ncbi:MAG: VWA domain-containing protein [Caldilineaceae bacterium]
MIARDVVLVFDVSGSMEGEKIEQARRAARYVVEHLNPDDQFNLIAFSTGTDAWAATLQPADAGNRAEALAWIDDLLANGSTDINRALLDALGQIEMSSHQRRGCERTPGLRALFDRRPAYPGRAGACPHRAQRRGQRRSSAVCVFSPLVWATM